MPSQVESVVVRGYQSAGKKGWPVHTLQIPSGEVTTEWLADLEPRLLLANRGFGDFRRTRPFGPKGFFAVYTDLQSLYLWLNGRRIDVMHDDVRLRRSLGECLHRFQVWVGGTIALDITYWYLDHEEVPDTDIFWYMARSLEPLEKRWRTHFFWQDRAKGEATTSQDYQRSLTERVRSAMKSDGQ